MKISLLSLIYCFSTLISAAGASTSASTSDRYILIHLDAASSERMSAEMEAGNLPNLQRTFGEQGFIRNAITYFPSKTPVVITNLRRATPIEDAEIVGWRSYDPESGRVVGRKSSFRRMTASQPRIARPNVLYGFPVIDQLTGHSLVNLAYLIDEYDVLEYYWYGLDTYGHVFGEEAYLHKMRQFDRQFGRLIRHLHPDVNIIIYSDHGMTFGTGIPMEDDIHEVVQPADFRSFSYPNLFVADHVRRDSLSMRLVRETDIDFTFVRTDTGTVVGYHDEGRVVLDENGASVRYLYEGHDIFGYYDHGYQGQYWGPHEWLDFSHDLEYPNAPINIYNLLRNPRAAHILTLFNSGSYSIESYSRYGNHGGLAARDMRVPLLLRGPQVDHLRERDYIWLPELFLDVPGVNFGFTPLRDRHYMQTWYDFEDERSFMQLSYSPVYRLRLGGNLTMHDFGNIERTQLWSKYDLVRSYLSRLWLGAGTDLNQSTLSPMLMLRFDIHYGSLVVRTSATTAGGHYLAFAYRFGSRFEVQLVNLSSAGIRIEL